MTRTIPGAMPRSEKLPQLTYDQFLLTGFPEGARPEWVNGEVCMMAAVTDEHEWVRKILWRVLDSYSQEVGSGEVFGEPFQMKTAPNLPGRSPDLMFVLAAHLPRLRRMYLEGPADVVVEIISPESRARDRGEKFREYLQGGVPEYWLIDLDRKQAEFYLRGTDGEYWPVACHDGVYRSATLEGLLLHTSWLWQRPLPTWVEIRNCLP